MFRAQPRGSKSPCMIDTLGDIGGRLTTTQSGMDIRVAQQQTRLSQSLLEKSTQDINARKKMDLQEVRVRLPRLQAQGTMVDTGRAGGRNKLRKMGGDSRGENKDSLFELLKLF